MERRITRDLTPYLSQRSRPTLGKQKALEFKKARTLKELAYLGCRIAAGVLFAAAGLAALAGFYSYLMHSPRFDIAIKEIHGLRHVPESQILLKLREIEEHGKNLFALDLNQLRRSLELLSWVKTATVRRVLPDKLVIRVVERVPIAFVRMEHATWLVDEDGMLLETRPDQFSAFDFPVILGFESGFEPEVLSRNKKRIALYRRLLKALDEHEAGLSRDLSEVHLQDAGSVSVVLNDDTVLVHLGSEQFQERFRRYLAMSREIKKKYPMLDSVDLRFENQVVINTANEKITSNSSN